MSRHFIRSFFPATAHQLESNPLSKTLISELLFSEETSVVCSEVQVWGFLRNPILLCHAAMGGVVGFYCATQLSKIPGLRYWPASFIFYGFMNVAAVPLHCLLPAVHRSPDHYPWLWIADTFWTGSSSSAVIFAVITMYQGDQRRQSQRRKRPISISWQSVALIGFISAGVFLLNGDHTLPLEMWYLLPTNAAAATVWLYLLHRVSQQADPGATQALFLCSSAAAVAVLGILLDSFFCHLFGQIFLDAMMAPTVVFMSCNIAFLTLFHYLVQRRKGDKEV